MALFLLLAAAALVEAYSGSSPTLEPPDRPARVTPRPSTLEPLADDSVQIPEAANLRRQEWQRDASQADAAGAEPRLAATNAEAQLLDFLHSQPPAAAMHLDRMPEELRPWADAGSNSREVAELLGSLQSTRSRIPEMDMMSLKGHYSLEYTTGLPIAVSNAIGSQPGQAVRDLTVVLSISYSGNVEISVSIFWLDGSTKFVFLRSRIRQRKLSPYFDVTSDDDEKTAMEVLYFSGNMLVTSNLYARDGLHHQALRAHGVDIDLPFANMDVWRRISPFDVSLQRGPLALWRFGLPIPFGWHEDVAPLEPPEGSGALVPRRSGIPLAGHDDVPPLEPPARSGTFLPRRSRIPSVLRDEVDAPEAPARSGAFLPRRSDVTPDSRVSRLADAAAQDLAYSELNGEKVGFVTRESILKILAILGLTALGAAIVHKRRQERMDESDWGSCAGSSVQLRQIFLPQPMGASFDTPLEWAAEYPHGEKLNPANEGLVFLFSESNAASSGSLTSRRRIKCHTAQRGRQMERRVSESARERSCAVSPPQFREHTRRSHAPSSRTANATRSRTPYARRYPRKLPPAAVVSALDFLNISRSIEWIAQRLPASFNSSSSPQSLRRFADAVRGAISIHCSVT